jgi:DNA-binding NarL/FixJ family response regulator
MKSQRVLVLLLAQAGALRDSLLALLSTLPGVQTLLADDVPAAEWAILAYQPKLLVMDIASAGGRMQQYLDLLHVEWLPMKCVVLADGEQQQEQAVTAGADVVLQHGFPAARLAATVALLLNGSAQARHAFAPTGYGQAGAVS